MKAYIIRSINDRCLLQRIAGGKGMAKSEKKKEKKYPKLFIFLNLLIGGFCGGFGVVSMMEASSDSPSTPPFMLMIGTILVYCFISLFLHIIIHEAGHLVFGLLSGYRFGSFRVGSFLFIRKDGRIKFKLFSLLGTGGQCLMLPPRKPLEQTPFILYNLGGSVANLILSGVAILFLGLVDEPSVLNTFSLIFIITGIGTALTNGIPMRRGLIANDGYNAIVLLKNRTARQCFINQLNTMGAFSEGKRLKDMPDEWFILPDDAEEYNNSLSTGLGAMACSRALDAGNYDLARKIGWDLLNNKEGLIAVHRFGLQLEMLLCEILGENRKEKLEELQSKELNRFIKSAPAHMDVIRLRYAHALINEKDEAKAEQILAFFNKVTRFYPYEGELAGMREFFASMRESHERRRAEAVETAEKQPEPAFLNEG